MRTGQKRHKKILPPDPPFWVVAHLLAVLISPTSCQRDFVQTNVLDGRPNNREATGLSREHIDLIRPLPHIAKQTFNGIRALKMSMHLLREGIKRQEMLFVLHQAAHRESQAPSILGFEGAQLAYCLRLCRLLAICPQVRPAPRCALVEGWQPGHCVA